MKNALLRMVTIIFTLAAFTACGGGGGGGTSAVQMTVTSTLPAAADIGVPPDSNVTITWDMAVDCNTIDETTVTSDSPGWALASCGDDRAIFFSSGQAYDTTYAVTVTSSVQSFGGAVATPLSFSFTVSPAPVPWTGTGLFGDVGVDIANYGTTDANGNVYLVGSTDNAVFDILLGGDDAFVAKLDAAGNQVWAVQFGGTNNDFANGVAVIGSAVYVVGDTGSNFATPLRGDVLAPSNANPDAFLAKLDAADGTILWDRQFGTIQGDIAWSVDVDAVGDIIVSGVTAGTLAGGGADGDDDAFLAKFSEAPDDIDLLPGKRLWVSQYGFDLSTEDAVSVVVGQDGFIYTAGETGEDDTNGDAYAARNSPTDGSQLELWKLGQATDTDFVNELVLDAEGKIYIAGLTATDIDGDGIDKLGISDAFLAKIDPAVDPAVADPVQWVEVLASADFDAAFGLDVDLFGNLYVSGEADGNLVGESNGWAGSGDIFTGRFTLDGDRNWLDFLGTAGNDAGFDLFLGDRGTVYVTGPTTGDLDGVINSSPGLDDAFIARYTSGGVLE